MPSATGSSQPRDWTCVSCISCISKWILYHWCHLGSPITYIQECLNTMQFDMYLDSHFQKYTNSMFLKVRNFIIFFSPLHLLRVIFLLWEALQWFPWLLNEKPRPGRDTWRRQVGLSSSAAEVLEASGPARGVGRLRWPNPCILDTFPGHVWQNQAKRGFLKQIIISCSRRLSTFLWLTENKRNVGGQGSSCKDCNIKEYTLRATPTPSGVRQEVETA